MLDLEFAHALNELLQQYPANTQINIVKEMIETESDKFKLKHLKHFFALKLIETRQEYSFPVLERNKLPIGKTNEHLN
jgi:hypothetical protein